jgi:hypothetical protein
MRKMIVSLAAIMFVSQFSLAIAADPNIRQAPSRPMAPQRGSTIPQLQLTPDFLYQQITGLKQQNASLNKQNASLNQQIQILRSQVNALRSVVQVTQNGTTIQAENLSLNAGKSLTLHSGKDTNLTASDNLNLTGGKNLSLIGGKDVTAEGEAQIKLKAPLIKLNDGTKGIALQNSPVAGGKVISGSTTVFAK